MASFWGTWGYGQSADHLPVLPRGRGAGPRTPLPPGQAEEAVFAQSLDPRRAPAGGRRPRGPGPLPRRAGDPRRTPGAVAPPCGGPPGTTSSQRFFLFGSAGVQAHSKPARPPWLGRGTPASAGGPPGDPPADPLCSRQQRGASLWLCRGPGSLLARQAALAWPGDPRLGRGTPGGPPAAVAPPGGRAPGTAALQAHDGLFFALPGPRLTLSPPGRPGLAGGPPADPRRSGAAWWTPAGNCSPPTLCHFVHLCTSAALQLCSSAPASQLWLFSWAARGTPGGPPALPAARGTPGGPPALPAARRTTPPGRLSESEAGLRL